MDAVAEFKAYLDQVLPGFRARYDDPEDFEARMAWHRLLHAGGWVGLGWSPEIGGRGLGVAEIVACEMALAAAGAPVIGGLLGVNNVAPTLAAFGTEEQRRSLPRILSGEEIWCQGFSEPDAGSDLAGLRLRALADREEFVLSGQKTWTSNGIEATHCLLLARTNPEAPKHRGISVLAIPLDLPGIERRPIVQIDGASDFAELFFDDVRVPRSALIGELDAGWQVTMTTLSHERAGAIVMAGRLRQDTASALRTVRDARPVGPVQRQDLLSRYCEARVLGMVGERALAAVDRGDSPGAEQSIIKLSYGQLNQRLGESLQAALGADGLRGDTPEARRLLKTRSSTIAGGTTEIVKTLIAERVLGLPKS